MQRTTQGQNQDYAVFPRDSWPLLPLHPDTRLTVFAWVRAGEHGVSELGFVPCRLRPDGCVIAVDPTSAEGREVVDYVERCIVSQNLNARIIAEGTPQIRGHRGLRVIPVG